MNQQKIPVRKKSARTRDGRPIKMRDGTEVVPADVLALLSGVNFGSVEKVLAALKVLHENSGTDLSLLTDLSGVPLHRVVLHDSRFRTRAENTLRVCEELSDRCIDKDVSEILNLAQRF